MQLPPIQKPVHEEKNAPWKVELENQAKKDLEKLGSISSESTLKNSFQKLLKILEHNPYQSKCEKLKGKRNTFSRKMNKKDRLIYKIQKDRKIVKVKQILRHYND